MTTFPLTERWERLCTVCRGKVEPEEGLPCKGCGGDRSNTFVEDFSRGGGVTSSRGLLLHCRFLVIFGPLFHRQLVDKGAELRSGDRGRVDDRDDDDAFDLYLFVTFADGRPRMVMEQFAQAAVLFFASVCRGGGQGEEWISGRERSVLID